MSSPLQSHTHAEPALTSSGWKPDTLTIPSHIPMKNYCYIHNFLITTILENPRLHPCIPSELFWFYNTRNPSATSTETQPGCVPIPLVPSQYLLPIAEVLPIIHLLHILLFWSTHAPSIATCLSFPGNLLNNPYCTCTFH